MYLLTPFRIFPAIVYQSYQNIYIASQDFVLFVSYTITFKRHLDELHYLIDVDSTIQFSNLIEKLYIGSKKETIVLFVKTIKWFNMVFIVPLTSAFSMFFSQFKEPTSKLHIVLTEDEQGMSVNHLPSLAWNGKKI